MPKFRKTTPRRLQRRENALFGASRRNYLGNETQFTPPPQSEVLGAMALHAPLISVPGYTYHKVRLVIY